MDKTKYLDMSGLEYLWGKIKETFVTRDGNKTLSDNNYTDSEKNAVATLAPIPNNIIDEIFNS